jgi:hypothetical protein
VKIPQSIGSGRVELVNFFGHAAVASRLREDPGFVLGAMLPDFATMIVARPPKVHGEPLIAGVAFHHRTDLAFHDATTFRSLVKQAFEDLAGRGLRRGSARAAAHVGVEILLDGELAREARARRAYSRALAARDLLASSISWSESDEPRRFVELCSRLETRGVAANDTSPELVAYRLERALSGRPRLALGQGDTAHVVHWAASARANVVQAAPCLMREVYSALARVGPLPT